MTLAEGRVLTFGETMLRMSPPGRLRFEQANTVDIWVAGCESNVAAALSGMGIGATWVSRLPDNLLGRKIESVLRARGVDVSHIIWSKSEGRAGLVFSEVGSAPRATTVVYDRTASAASMLTPADVPQELFETHAHLHVSGITPALSASCCETVADAVRRATESGLTVSFDVNYRAKLWGAQEAASALEPIMRQVGLLMCSSSDASLVFGLSGTIEQAAKALRDRFGVPTAIVTGGSDGAAACDVDGPCSTAAIPVETTVDRFGSGDAFAAGFLSGYLSGKSTFESLRIGVAAGALKRTIPGDILIANRAEIESIMAQETATWR
jgi:2-dehydro-3-deoxygluconokinase